MDAWDSFKNVAVAQRDSDKKKPEFYSIPIQIIKSDGTRWRTNGIGMQAQLQPEEPAQNILNIVVELKPGTFNGNVDEAISRIKDFCANNSVEMPLRSEIIIINGVTHQYNGQAGIDINMMLEWCDIKPKTSPSPR